MNAVFQIDPSIVTATERLVLLNLANHGNDHGRNAYPSVTRIAAETSLHRRAIYDALGRLRQKGLIVAAGTATRGVVRYTLVLKRLRASDRDSQSRPVHDVHTSGAPDSHDPVHDMHTSCAADAQVPVHDAHFTCAPDAPDPLLNRDLNRDLNRHTPSLAALARVGGNGRSSIARTEDNGNGLRDGFDAFWKVYPKKVAKEHAWRAWRERKPSAELTAQIVAALAWQRQQDSWLRDSGRYVPSPAKWIRAGRWDDEPSTTPQLNDSTLAIIRAGEEFLKS